MAGFPTGPEVTACFWVLTKRYQWQYRPHHDNPYVVGELCCGEGGDEMMCRSTIWGSPRGDKPAQANVWWKMARACQHGKAPECVRWDEGWTTEP